MSSQQSNTQTFVGNLTADPKLIPGKNGKANRAIFSVAVEEYRGKDAEAATHFINFTAWDRPNAPLASNIAASLSKGTRAIVLATVNTYTKPVEIDGDEKELTMVSFTAESAGPDLTWATADVQRAKAKGKRAAEVEEDEEDEEEQEEAPAPARRRTSARSSARKPAPVDEDDDF